MAIQWQTVRLRVVGIRALIMHSDRLADPLAPITKKMKTITSKRKKTEEDLERMAQLEFMAGMYHDEDMGPFIPGKNFHATLVNGAKLSKQGANFKRAMEVVTESAPLEYEGPRTLEELWGDPLFRLTTSVKVQTSRVMRTRPMFPSGWAAEFDVRHDPTQIDKETLIRVAQEAGDYVGLCDYRPFYGKFTVKEI